ncbi:MAG: sarcosine oxidase subunit gamma [Hyphomicrobiales bacterium]
MSEFTLEAKPFLGGYKRDVGGVSLEEVTGLAIVSIAAPRGEETKLKATMKSAYGCVFPAPGAIAHAKDKKTRFVGMSPDQVFALFDHDGADAAEIIGKKLKARGYVTLQSDNWVTLRASGTRVREALERICPVDLNPNAFAIDHAARTVMEHLGVVIMREDKDTFLLLSASSSAQSFLHAVETSLEYAL